MKEKIVEYLNGLGIEGLDSSSTTDEIAKIVAIHTVPKATYNELNSKFKNETTARASVEDEKNNLETMLSTYKSKDTELESLTKSVKELKEENTRMKARSIFEKANIAEDKIDTLLKQVVAAENPIELANTFAEMLKTQVAETKKETESEMLQSTPKPSIKETGNESKEITLEEFNKMTFAEKKQLYFDDRETYDKLVSQD